MDISFMTGNLYNFSFNSFDNTISVNMHAFTFHKRSDAVYENIMKTLIQV